MFSLVPALLWTLRITEVDLNIRRYREVFVLGHLQPSIPGQRAFQGSGEFANMLTQCGNDHFRVLAGHLVISMAKREWRSTRVAM